MSGEIDANTQVSHTDDSGRTLSGMGTDVDKLAETMERHAPPEPQGKPAGTAVVPAAAEGELAGTPAAQDAKPTRGAQRFSELAKARDAEKARADAAEARAKELEARIATPPPAREPEPAPVAAGPAQPAAAPQKFAFPNYEKFLETNPNASYDEWELERFQAFDAWKDSRTTANVSGLVSQQLHQERGRQEFRAIVDKSFAKGREAYADFDTVLTSGPGAGINLHATDIDKATQRVTAIFRHPQSEHLQYAIMKDGDLAKQLGAMDDIDFGMALARLVPAASGAPAQRAYTPPPAPMTPVNGNGATASTPSSELAGKSFDFDKSGYREKRAAERKARR